ncbi:MAG TPA: arylsulfatase [Bacteroidales bacterium]|nr:arylsulfatase [Bacteroidales bacterium]
MRHLNYFLITILFISSSIVSCQRNTPENPPNIVYILADDLGIGDLGVYGQDVIKTPNLDKLASQGMRFTNHYSGSTVCAPSRSVLMTGEHSGHTPIRGNREIKPEGQFPLEAEAFTVAEMLKEAGYTTGAFGKWGLGFPGSAGDPNNQGFDEFFGYNCQRYAHRYYPAYLWHNDKKVDLEGNDWTQTETYAPDVIQEKVLEFIDANKDNAFFLFYPSTIPHAELLVPDDEIFAQYKGKFEETPYLGGNTKERREQAPYGPNMKITRYAPQDQPKATYAAMVTRLDKQVGEVVEKLKEHGLLENTIIMFASDNGIHKEGGINPEDFNSNGIYRGAKRDLYEGGIKSPMIASWQGKIEPGSATDHISAFWDIMPTFAEVAGITAPDNIDGISFLPTLLEKDTQKQHDILYWEFHGRGGKQAVRQGNWKAVRLNYLRPEETTVELYNLKDDPSESTDLADEHPEKVEELVSIMDKEHTENEDYPFIPGE